MLPDSTQNLLIHESDQASLLDQSYQQFAPLIIADGQSADLAELLKGAKEQVFQIGSTDDPIGLISKVLDRQRQEGQFVEELHVFAHGSQEGIHLSGQFIDTAELEKNAVELGTWNLKRIVLWSCYVGGHSQWIDKLEELTGAEVFSSQGPINREQTCVQSSQSNQKDLSDIIDQQIIDIWEGSLEWQQIGSDFNPSGNSWDNQASVSLSSDGSILAIGLKGIKVGNTQQWGTVRIYSNNNGTWEQIGADISPAKSSAFGWSVSLSSDGSIVAVGGPHKQGMGGWNDRFHGSTSIYKNVDDNWVQVGDNIDANTDAPKGITHGHSVSLSGDGSTVAISAKGRESYDNIDSDCYVRVYKNVDDTWVQVGSDISRTKFSPGHNRPMAQTISLSDDGEVLVIGDGG